MEKERIRHREKSFLTGKKRMEKLKVLMKYAGISVFEYFPDADRLVLYDEQLKEERRMQPFLGRLEELCTVYPENREKLRGFLTGNIRYLSSCLAATRTSWPWEPGKWKRQGRMRWTSIWDVLCRKSSATEKDPH